MASVTLNLSDQLKARVESFSRWLPAILETSLLALKTPAYEAASEFIEFLASNPLPQAVHNYRLSEVVQKRVEGLLEHNREGILSDVEEKELDEYLRLEHVVRMVKAKLATDELAGV